MRNYNVVAISVLEGRSTTVAKFPRCTFLVGYERHRDPDLVGLIRFYVIFTTESEFCE